MDPVSAFVFAAIVATVWTADWAKDFRDALSGNGLPRHERRMQERAQEHELRTLRLQQRHAERLAGRGGPTVAEAVAGRISNPRPRKARDDMGPVRGWWWDLCADRAEQLTRERRARDERRANGEQMWQKLRDRAAERARRAAQQWRDRHQPQDPHRQWWDSERITDPPPARPATDQPDPGAPDTTPVDAEVVDEPQPSSPRRPELEPGWPEPPSPENPPGTADAVTGRIPEPLGSTPADHTTSTQGDTPMAKSPADEVAALTQEIDRQLDGGFTPDKYLMARRNRMSQLAGLAADNDQGKSSGHGGNPAVPRHSAEVSALNGETVDPESLGSFAGGMQQVAAAMAASIEASIANLESLGVSGGPIDDLRAMADAAAVLAGRSQSTAAHAASHRDIQGVAHSDPTVGGENYLGIGAAAR